MSDGRALANPSSDELARLAEYFDRTDAADLPWEEATDLAVDRANFQSVPLRLPRNEVAALRRRAARVGITYTTLIRLIVRRYLRAAP